MAKPLAFVLGGGGARGALQVGALWALSEAGYRPQLLVRTSIGAVNATFLAIHDHDPAAIDLLKQAWADATAMDLLPANYLWLTLRNLFRSSDSNGYHRLKKFMQDHGLSSQMRFADVKDYRLILVASNISSGQPALYGADPNSTILDGLLASMAIPPWVKPVEQDQGFLLDGGAVSPLPIEPALSVGAKEIIALDIRDRRTLSNSMSSFGSVITHMIDTVEQRYIYLEKKLAAADGVELRIIDLHGGQPVEIWDFSHTEELIERGYQLTQETIHSWKKESPFYLHTKLLKRLKSIIRLS